MLELLRPYPLVKDSGARSLGRVPAHWEVRRLKQAFGRIVGGSTPSGAEAHFWDGNIVWITPTDVSRSSRLRDSERRITEEGLATCSTELVPPGSLIVTSRAPVGNVAIAEVELCTNQGCKAFVTSPSTSCPEFGLHVLGILKEELQSVATGTTFAEISTSRIGDIRIPLPPLAEQTAIVRFLDYMDRRIRRAIRAKQKLVKLLEEYKQALIHQAVTGRINVRTGQPYAAYKPSGVEWLGDVPEHWDVRKLRQCVSIVGGMTPSMLEQRYWHGEIPWVTPKDMKHSEINEPQMHVSKAAIRETSLRLIQPPAILMVVRGMILARRVPIAYTSVPVTINQDMKALQPAVDLDAKYLAHQLFSNQQAFERLIDEAGHGTRRLPTERWRDLRLLIPPVADQRAVVEQLAKATRVSDAAVARAERAIKVLREYQTRLIADVVTGKLDVREAAARLPDEVDEPESFEETGTSGADEPLDEELETNV